MYLAYSPHVNFIKAGRCTESPTDLYSRYRYCYGNETIVLAFPFNQIERPDTTIETIEGLFKEYFFDKQIRLRGELFDKSYLELYCNFLKAETWNGPMELNNENESIEKQNMLIKEKREKEGRTDDDAIRNREERDEHLKIFWMITSSDMNVVLFGATSKSAKEVVSRKYGTYYGDNTVIYFVDYDGDNIRCNELKENMLNTFISRGCNLTIMEFLFKKEYLHDYIEYMKRTSCKDVLYAKIPLHLERNPDYNPRKKSSYRCRHIKG